jgi:hemolysin III
MINNIPSYTKSEQIANRITHGFGILFSFAVLIILIKTSIKTGDIWIVFSCGIFSLSLILLYISSTLYHTLTDMKSIMLLRRMDHISIFILIAGTYTPILTITTEGPLSKILFALIWVMAITGLILKILGKMNSRVFSVIYYLTMGWICILPGRQIIENIPDLSLILIVTGGLSYTLGVIFYLWKRLPYNHAIWHLFVLGGSILHFYAIRHLL